MELNSGQQAAVDAMRSGENVFVTGEGGTGKSVAVGKAVNLLRRDGRKTVLCAPTGIAARNIGGATIHSVFRFDLGPKVADSLEDVQPSKVVQEADTIIIDEIGMVRRDLMDAVARVVELENEARAEDPERNRLQLVVVGDFSQLPPVVTDKDKAALVAHYGQRSATTGFYAFEADGWDRMGFRVCQLTEPMRQSDPTFVAMLNRARVGDASCLGYFNRLAGRPETPPEAVSIVALNKDAERVNLGRLATLDGESRQFFGSVSGEFRRNDMAAPETLELKVGARVICVANDKDAGYINGSTGVVTDLRGKSAEGLPAVMVRLDGGPEVAVVRRQWENVAYRVTGGEGGRRHLEQVVLGSFVQYPLKLAWAITYHKSQGQTLGTVSIDPKTFGPGMLYVGLSRATSAAGIWLTREIDQSNLKADEAVVKFYEDTCGWTAPPPATGDEVPDLTPRHKPAEEHPKSIKKAKTAVISNSNSNKNKKSSLKEIQEELHELLGRGGRTWVRVYELISRVHREKLYEPEHKSFSAWLRAEAKREGVAESILWHRKSAGDFYTEWAEGKAGAPALAEGKGLSEENLNLVRKIAKAAPERANVLMGKMIENGLSTKDLRREWREMRPTAKRAPEEAADTGQITPMSTARASRSGLSVSCADADAFEAVLAAIRAAGIEVDLVA